MVGLRGRGGGDQGSMGVVGSRGRGGGGQGV